MNAIEIKAQLEELLTRVNSMENQYGDYVFSEEQMISFVRDLHEEFMKGVKLNIEQMHFDDADDFIDLELDYNKQISVSINTDTLSDRIMNEIDVDIDDDDLKVTIDNTYECMKRNIG